MNNYELLLQKIDAFTRKYYTNKLIRGLIWFFALVIGYFTFLSVLEYYLYLPSAVRWAFFVSFFAITLCLLWFNIVSPVMKMNRLGQLISHQEAARIIAQHFTHVKDKLLNVLQLEELRHSTQATELIVASIDQKIDELKPVPFSNAIRLGENKRYLKYLAVPVLLTLVLLFVNAKIFTEGTNRILHADQQFEKQAPFKFIIDEARLRTVENNNFLLSLQLDGLVLPNEVLLVTDEATFKMKKRDKSHFEYEFVNLQHSVPFHFKASGYDSKAYTLTVVPRPAVSSFSVSFDYPAYTKRQDELLKNVGDLTVPCGTQITWNIQSRNTENIFFHVNDSLISTTNSARNSCLISKRFLQNADYAFFLSGRQILNADSLQYSIRVIPDEYPQIFVREIKDSTTPFFLFYTGEVSDDYGIRNLVFNYKIERADSAGSPYKQLAVATNGGEKISQFVYDFDLKKMNLRAGDRLVYFFEVFDNDGVHGSKSSRSGTMEFLVPTLSEFEKITEQTNENIKDDLKDLAKESKDIQAEMEKVRNDLMQKKDLGWQDKKKISDLINRQQQLENKVENLQQKNELNNKQQEDYKELSPEIKEKQDALEKLFEQVLDPETKALMDKLEKMLNELKKEDALKNMDEMKMNNEELEKELDRMLDLFKDLEAEQKMKETASKLDELAKKQEELANESKDPNADSKELEKKQEEINKQLEELKKDLDDIEKLNQENGTEMNMDEVQEQMQEAREKTDDAQKQLQQNQKQDAAQKQKSAAEDMKKMSETLKKMQQENEQQQMEEDYKSLMQLLENLVQLSFDQEKLLNDFKSAGINTASYINLIKQQYKIKDDSRMIEDSLYALAGRVEQIQKFVTDEINNVNRNLAYAIDNLEARRPLDALSRQQFVMTGYNNLALMLSEIQQQMQMAMAEGKKQQPQDGKPNSSCNKPGQGKPKAGTISKMQQQLNDQIKEMGEMKKAGQLNSKQEAQKFSELAQKQAAIRQALQELDKSENQLNDKGEKPLGDLQKLADDMNQTETELLNKQLTEQMLLRQKNITVRLLDAEKAEKEQDQNDQRESKSSPDIEHKVPAGIEEYIKKREAELELYRKIPPSLNPFYKNLVEKYLQNVPL